MVESNRKITFDLCDLLKEQRSKEGVLHQRIQSLKADLADTEARERMLVADADSLAEVGR
jgi:hypothetical protein